jgi:DNA polymerase/3'-5' exonuclease PolX
MNDIEKLTTYFMEIKGISGRKARYFRAAGQLLTLCDHSLEKAKEMIGKAKKWADSEGLEWELETVNKRYLELNK